MIILLLLLAAWGIYSQLALALLGIEFLLHLLRFLVDSLLRNRTEVSHETAFTINNFLAAFRDAFTFEKLLLLIAFDL